MQGRSIAPLLRGQRAGWPQELLVQISETQIGRALRTKRWKYGVAAPNIGPWGKANTQPASPVYMEESLYDLDCDPYELINLVGLGSHRELSDTLRNRLVACMVAAGEAAPVIEAAPPRHGGQRSVLPEEFGA